MVAVVTDSTDADVVLVFTSIGVMLLVGIVLSLLFTPKVIAVYKLTAEAAKRTESEALAALNDVPASLSDGSKISELSREVAWLHGQIQLYRDRLGEHGPSPVMPSLHAHGNSGHGTHTHSGTPIGSAVPYVPGLTGGPGSPLPVGIHPHNPPATPTRPAAPRSPLIVAKNNTLTGSNGGHSPVLGPHSHHSGSGSGAPGINIICDISLRFLLILVLMVLYDRFSQRWTGSWSSFQSYEEC
jgi:hypothetical protein